MSGTEEMEEALAQKVNWIREAAGERFDTIELAMLLQNVAITEDRQAHADRVAAEFDMTPEQMLAAPAYPIGSVDAVIEHLLALRQQFGVSYFSVFPWDIEAFAPVVARLKDR